LAESNVTHDDVRNLSTHVADAIGDGALAARLMGKLCREIGPRPPASEAMRAAQRLIADGLASIGASNVGTEPVNVFAWTDRPASLAVDLPGGRSTSYPVYQHVHTASGEVAGELVDVGFASAAELDAAAGPPARPGAIALSHTYDRPGAGGAYVTIQQKFSAIWERGFAGIVARGLPGTGLPQIELVGVSSDAPVPVVGVSAEVGDELAAATRTGRVGARITTGGVSRHDRCANLVATLGPADAGNAILLSAHLDTFDNNPGALDNLTGVLTLIEIVRAVAPHQSAFRRPLRLVIFTGEEYGFIGSKAYVKRHHAALDELALVFNMDTLFPATAAGIAVMGSPPLRDYFERHARLAGLDVDVRDLFCMSSDYLPFVLAGVPAARPAQWYGEFPPQSHTTADVPERLPIEWIVRNALVHGTLLLRALLDAEPLPGRRSTPHEVADTLARENVIPQLRLFEFEV
jgi:hypothetical protein